MGVVLDPGGTLRGTDECGVRGVGLEPLQPRGVTVPVPAVYEGSAAGTSPEKDNRRTIRRVKRQRRRDFETETKKRLVLTFHFLLPQLSPPVSTATTT